MNSVTLYPKDKKVKVRKPDGAHLSEEGEPVVMNAYWHRRVREGSVTTNMPEVATDKTKDSVKAKGSK
ncbi:DUF2635 domain-containing protein [Grimontia sp. NTOU-MAR1]|uniref:DUF2635 domain-containing protein n=1 Tax=Grimontia sp. NTOU-MAR1 TaxID=3111011 RepID=UPI002DBEBE83|nr:DUF2635 domain-containing protein [Grimontia sp. NTOU-MAR1]WRV98573.1 DUF2635 domain-containing protein [Grimontia sp. NTOU-MAR1]